MFRAAAWRRLAGAAASAGRRRQQEKLAQLNGAGNDGLLRKSDARLLSSAGWVRATGSLRMSSADVESALVKEYEHATGLEREEIEARLEGKSRFELAPPRGPFGTKDAPAIVESQFDERIVGCSGGFAEEEHDVVWFKLQKGITHECAVCAQVFDLKVIGAGGKPGAHH